jgi:hypothetical protein
MLWNTHVRIRWTIPLIRQTGRAREHVLFWGVARDSLPWRSCQNDIYTVPKDSDSRRTKICSIIYCCSCYGGTDMKCIRSHPKQKYQLIPRKCFAFIGYRRDFMKFSAYTSYGRTYRLIAFFDACFFYNFLNQRFRRCDVLNLFIFSKVI